MKQNKNEVLTIDMSLESIMNLNDFKIGMTSSRNIYNKLVRNSGSDGMFVIDTFCRIIPSYLTTIESVHVKDQIADGVKALYDHIWEVQYHKENSWKPDGWEDKLFDLSLKIHVACSLIRRICDSTRLGYTENHFNPMIFDPSFQLGMAMYKAILDTELDKYSPILIGSFKLLKEIYNNEKSK